MTTLTTACEYCGYEAMAKKFRNGRCRAVQGCRARIIAARPTYLAAFFKLDSATRGAIAMEADASTTAFLAALRSDDCKTSDLPKVVTIEDGMRSRGLI